MHDQIHIDNVRHVLVRLEETIIFALIERAQFRHNPCVYTPEFFGDVLGGESLCGFMLLECERSHAKVRRYASPDEHPFFENLPAPILPPLGSAKNPLVPNPININVQIRDMYETRIIPLICAPGDDEQYGSAAVCDVACLQAVSKRIHYGKFVAESKYRAPGAALIDALQRKNRHLIMDAITDGQVERAVLRRVAAKAQCYTAELNQGTAAPTISADVILRIYRDWIIPLNKQVQVDYLLHRTAQTQP